MSEIAVSAQDLGKLYHIGRRLESYRTLRDSVAGAVRRLRAGRGAPGSDPTIWALRNVSFDIRQGEVVGVIGRNGAGKSTLLKILTRITEPTEGSVELRGRVGSLLEVGTGFHPELTGRENIYLNGAILGMRKSEIDRKFDEIVAFAEIEKFLDTPVKRYSSGMYVRLAFAVAAHLEPEILLVDEVLAVGDAAFQKKCLGKMGEVAQAGRTVFFVSHNLAAVRRLCTRTLLLSAGRVVMEGVTEEVIDRYLTDVGRHDAPEVELPSGAPGAPGEGICLRFLAQDGTPRIEFRPGERWRVIFEFRQTKAMPQVIAAIGLTTIDAIPIVTYWSQARDLVPGDYSVEFECDLTIAHSELAFVVGLSSEERTFYYVENAARVSIGQVAVGAQPLRISGSGLMYSVQRPEIRGKAAQR